MLIKRNVRVAGLWIAMREMPGTAEITAIYPEFSTAFAPTLVGGLLGRCLVVIHDLVRLGTTLGYEVMHNKSVYAVASIRLEILRARPEGDETRDEKEFPEDP